jgi:hypothetical protein
MTLFTIEDSFLLISDQWEVKIRQFTVGVLIPLVRKLKIILTYWGEIRITLFKKTFALLGGIL